MNCFPQLVTGAVAQYPLSRCNLRRTVATEFLDGSSLKLADDAASVVEWRLGFDGLSTDEWQALENFFLNAEGQLSAFVFLDPMANLLTWSADLTRSAWHRDPGLTITGSQPDPLGGALAFRVVNNAQVPQTLTQAIGGPANFQYCTSLYASAAAPETITLVQNSGPSVLKSSFTLGTDWRRCTLPAQLSSTDDVVTFGFELDPGSTVLVFGLQTEAQPAAGAYRATYEHGGVYPNTRFAEDTLELISPDPDQYSCAVRLRSVGV